MTYTLEVYGRTWEGCRSVYPYRLMAPVFTEEAVKRAAGDFAEVIDWRLVEHSTTYETLRSARYSTKREIHTHRTLRGFRNGMTPGRFQRLANGG